jgi:hypothetical protein
MAPALRIPLSLSLDEFERNASKAGARIAEFTKATAKQFANSNSEMLGAGVAAATGFSTAWGQAAVRASLDIGKFAVASTIAIKGVIEIIGAAREQLKEMVDIADKAENVSVSPSFFQAFTSEADNLKVSVGEMEGALTSAFRATREISPIDLSKWETGKERISDVEKALRVYNATLAKAAGQKLEGLVLFRDAESQEQKIVAVLQAMKQLDAIGQHAASLDLASKLFDSKTVDNFRIGKLTADGMLTTLKEASAASAGIFPDELVKRAKEIDDNLKRAHQTLDKELKPSWNELANTLLTIKGYWAEIINLIAKAANVINTIEISSTKKELVEVKKALADGTGLFGIPRLPEWASRAIGSKTGEESLREREKYLEDRIRSLEGQVIGQGGGPGHGRGSRGTGAEPTLRPSGGAGRDRFDASADSIEKRTAALLAEAAAIDKTADARERDRIVAELETVAKQANKEAGLGENVVTEEQRQRIDAVAEAYGRAALAIEKAHSPLATFARESANVGKALNQFAASALDSTTNALADVVTGSKTAGEAFRSLANSIISDLARIAIRKSITGPLAALFGLADGGPVEGFDDGGLFSGAGTSRSDSNIIRVSNGEYIVNAEATARHRHLLDAINGGRLPGFAAGGIVVPDSVRSASASSAPLQVTYAPRYSIAPGVTPQEFAALRREMESDRREFAGKTVRAIREAQRRSVRL